MDSKQTHKVFIRLVNFSEDANLAINKAIKFSTDERCTEVNSVHLFLALVGNTTIGNDIMNRLETSFDELYDQYKFLASCGDYGTSDGNTNQLSFSFPLDLFSRELYQIIMTVTNSSMSHGREVTTDSLMDAMLASRPVSLDRYFDNIGISFDEIEEMQYEIFYIPEELEGLVEDMNETVNIDKKTIVNVDNYVDDLFEILSRKLKANPCLIGESGVGKTTIVERLVQRIVSEEVPLESFKSSHVVYINGGVLTAGTRYRGDFEERMKLIIDWASRSNVILFLDEFHTFINSGGSRESADTAGNMIKKSLSDGLIRIIGATTFSEYHRFIEKDKAFDGRMQTVEVKEPSAEDTIAMIKGSVCDYEDYHGVEMPLDVLEESVRLADVYVKSKHFPDKAYTIIDQACAKTKISKQSTVTLDIVHSVISKVAKMNVSRLKDSEAKQLMCLEDTIAKDLIGQKDAVKTVCKAIRRAKAGVKDENKPLASFLFVGPTGVGKTELCKILSREVAIGDTPLIRIDMSEYSDKIAVNKIIGSAPGYVGYGDGGGLTEKVKHNPYSIVLLDEIEKAHPDIFDTFLQVLDDGRLTDSEGTTVDFTKCIIVMTSNAGYGADGMNKGPLGFSSNNGDTKDKEKIAMSALESTFKPEFLNRIDNIVVFDKLNKEQCKDIARLMLDKIKTRVEKKGINIAFSDSVVNKVVELGYSDKYGARNLKREIQNSVEDILADKILSGELKEGTSVKVNWGEKTGIKVSTVSI